MSENHTVVLNAEELEAVIVGLRLLQVRGFAGPIQLAPDDATQPREYFVWLNFDQLDKLIRRINAGKGEK